MNESDYAQTAECHLSHFALGTDGAISVSVVFVTVGMHDTGPAWSTPSVPSLCRLLWNRAAYDLAGVRFLCHTKGTGGSKRRAARSSMGTWLVWRDSQSCQEHIAQSFNSNCTVTPQRWPSLNSVHKALAEAEDLWLEGRDEGFGDAGHRKSSVGEAVVAHGDRTLFLKTDQQARNSVSQLMKLCSATTTWHSVLAWWMHRVMPLFCKAMMHQPRSYRSQQLA